MSLFKLKTWWQTHQGEGGEEFDQGSLCIGNVDNDIRGSNKIITGSFSGVLRVYAPTAPEYQPSDLLLETQLDAPILQLALGRFHPGVALSLAVLQPKALILYQVASGGKPGEEVNYLSLHQIYRHEIEHTAANMATGSFGNSLSLDHILVQAYDGQIYIFEHASLIVSTYLRNFLVPGPIAYVAQSDALVTCTSAFELESYTYQSFANASSDKNAAAAATPGALPQTGPTYGPTHGPTHGPTQAGKVARSMGTSKGLAPEWSLVLGEFAVDIQVSPCTSSSEEDATDIVVLGEHTLFVVSHDGKLKAQRKLDYHPAAAINYRCALET